MNTVGEERIEISFEFYDTQIQQIKVIKWGKQLGANLLYLYEDLPDMSIVILVWIWSL